MLRRAGCGAGGIGIDPVMAEQVELCVGMRGLCAGVERLGVAG